MPIHGHAVANGLLRRWTTRLKAAASRPDTDARTAGAGPHYALWACAFGPEITSLAALVLAGDPSPPDQRQAAVHGDANLQYDGALSVLADELY